MTMFLKRPLLKASNLLFFSSLLLASPSHANDSPSSNNFELVLNTLQQVESQEVQANLLKGILDGLSGIKIISPPSTWEQLNKKLSESKNAKIQGYLMLLNQKFGNKQAIELALKTLKNKQESTEIRRKYLASLLIQKSPELLVLLKEILPKASSRLLLFIFIFILLLKIEMLSFLIKFKVFKYA